MKKKLTSQKWQICIFIIVESSTHAQTYVKSQRKLSKFAIFAQNFHTIFISLNR